MKFRFYSLSFLSSLFLLSCGTTTSATFTLRGSNSQTETAAQNTQTLSGPKSLVLNTQVLYLGTLADCTNLKAVVDFGESTEEDNVFLNPLLFTANPSPNTYRCLAIKMKDLVTIRVNKVASDTWPETCLTNTNYVKDLYLASSTDIWKDVEGTAITPTGTEDTPIENTITLFATTDRSLAIASPLALAPSQVFPLRSAISLPSKITFYLDYTGGIDGSTSCSLQTGTLGFR